MSAAPPFNLIALNGDALTAPCCTVEGLWAGLGGGANALCVTVYLTRDRQVICAPGAALEIASNTTAIRHLSLSEIQTLDAGRDWRSTVLNQHHQPTGETGEDTPWNGSIGRATAFASLEEILRQFGRRTPLYIALPGNNYRLGRTLALATTDLLQRFGLHQRVPLIANPGLCQFLRQRLYPGRLAMDATADNAVSTCTELAQTLNCDNLVGWAETFTSLTDTVSLPWLLFSQCPYTITPATLTQLIEAGPAVAGLIVKGVLPTSEHLRPGFEVMTDTFSGQQIDQKRWTAGYSHTNRDTRIYQDDGLHIAISAGGSYSGAAAVSCISYHGDFDARVDFWVQAPHQGTTFELAAIGIDPGYFNIDNSTLSDRTVNLTFDVHGAPPYASSERDEDDGFRTGWNNSFNLTKVGEVSHRNDSLDIQPWSASSVNMYNKYRRDVGYGGGDSPRGSLRLIRRGAVFSSYYRDARNSAWVCSGTVLVHNLPDEAFIRLAAKHWKKSNPTPPNNHIVFSNFSLSQF